ncbi:MAG: hypothetical protein HQL21_04015 [Candidatus Omnitrophica bacterium]|nr:hypothetical protein [Candidatus Omnitrophota bacterium]
MKKNIFIFVLFSMMALSGCALTMKDVPLLGASATQEAGPGSGISLGMTREQVTAVMNKLVTVGFEIDSSSGVTKAIQINSLYSAEVLTLGPQAYQVDYYIVDTQKAQTRIADADLFPVVFQNNILAAKGQAELTALKEKYQSK